MEDYGFKRKLLTPDQAYAKISHFCAFQERSHYEVKMKLSGYGIPRADANPILSKLIEEGFLNEVESSGSNNGAGKRSRWS